MCAIHPKVVVVPASPSISNPTAALSSVPPEDDAAVYSSPFQAAMRSSPRVSASRAASVPVFDAMLEKATRLCEAQTGHLIRYEDGEFSRAASFGVPEDFDKIMPRNQPLAGIVTRDSVPFRTLETRSTIHIVDMREDPSYLAGAPAEVAGVEEDFVRSVLFVPLLREGEVIGNFVLHRPEVRPFSDRQIALVENFAAQAVIAMENARLITETREALEQQTATAEVLQVINSSPGDLAPVFDAMLEKATRLCEAAFGILLTYDGNQFRHAALRGIPPAYAEFMREHPPIYAPASAPGRLAAGERLVQVIDMMDTDLYQSGEANRRAIVDLAGARTIIAVALRKDRVLLGTIVVFRQEVRPFTEKQLALLENFAAQAVIAMENARLLTETREALEQQTATAEVLRTIANSPADAERALDTIAQVTSRLFDASNVNIRRLDADILRYAATFGLGAAEFRARAPEAPLDPRSLPGCAIIEKRQISIDDVRDPVVLERFPSAALIGPSRTRVATPLLREGQAIGAIITQPHRLFEDRVKYGREIAGRGIDDMKNFSGYTQ